MRLFLVILLFLGTACENRHEAWTWAGQSLQLEFARTADERLRGLQGHAPLAAHQGMLFVYEDEAPRYFWMKDVPFDLDLAYFDGRGRVLSIHHLRAEDTTPVPSVGGAQFALEMPAGWFSRQGIKSGDLWPRLALERRQ